MNIDSFHSVQEVARKFYYDVFSKKILSAEHPYYWCIFELTDNKGIT